MGMRSALGGAGLSLLGVLIVEGLLAAGLQPLTPVGWPGGGMVVGAALLGPFGALGGTLVAGAYLVLQALQPARFPAFFAQPVIVAGWIVGLGALTALLMTIRRRMLGELVSARALRESEERFRHLAEMSSDWYWEQDENFRFTFMSGRLGERTGIESGQHLGRTRWELPEQHLTEEQWREHRALLERHEPFRDFVMRRPDRDGRAHWVSISGEPLFDAAGRFAGYRGIGRDITAQVAAETELRAAKQRLEHALDGSSAALWDADLDTRRVFLSEAWAAIAGGSRGATVRTIPDLAALLHPEDIEPVRRAAVEAMKGLRPDYTVEHRVRTASGEWRWILSRGRVTERDPASGRARRMIGTNVDITERKRVEAALQQVAQYDSLTGAANRALLEDRLRQASARSRRDATAVAVLYVDVDRFKEVNDTLGHAAGDALLREKTARLRGCMRESDTVARIGGDEFVVLLEGLKSPADAERVAEKIVAAAREPFAVDGRALRSSVSVGVAFGRGEWSAEELVRRADSALYAAKQAGRDTFRVG